MIGQQEYIFPSRESKVELTDTNEKGMTSIQTDDPVNSGQVVQGVLKEHKIHRGLVVIVLL